MATQQTPDTRAIVRPRTALDHFEIAQWTPDPPINRLVDRFWRTAWRLPEPFVQPIVTFPVVNMVFQSTGSATVSGPRTGNDHRVLEGSGWALGVMFHPGGFEPLFGRPMADLVDRRVPIAEALGPEADNLTQAVLTAGDDDERLAAIVGFLTDRVPAEQTEGEQLNTLLVEAREAEPQVTSVARLADLNGVSVRTLQRLFRRHIGLSPKAVLDRYRLHATADRAGDPVQNWSEVAQAVGYADQAHMTTSFANSYGAPPASYSRTETAGQAPVRPPTVDQ